jgi:ABC-type multidrug transport system fused ATPase/permease subunit
VVPPSPTPRRPLGQRLRGALAVFREVPGTVRLVWEGDRAGAIILAFGTIIGALLPAAMAWVGKLIVDGVVHARDTQSAADQHHVLMLVGLELALVVVNTAGNRLLNLARELMRARLGHFIELRILDKALELELKHFEDADVYDKMQRARREASDRPLALVQQLFTIIQNLLTLAAYSALLIKLSPWSVVVIVLASIPSFIAEASLARSSFRINSWRAPEHRKLNYLEWIITRDSHVKEVKLFDLGDLVLGRYRAMFRKFYAEDRGMAIKRMVYGFGLGLLSLGAFYGCYAVVAGRAAATSISLGDMTLYLAVFRQGQQAFQTILSAVGSMYENALFMSDLFVYFAIPTGGERPRITPALSAPKGLDNTIELDHVSFKYPGKDNWALRDLTLTIRPGEKIGLVGENGAGKSTLIKLLLRLYTPTEGAIRYGGVDLQDMDPTELRSRVGAVYQDFVRYQFTAGENIGLGHTPDLDKPEKIAKAAERGGAATVIDALPHKYDTVLGGWFESGQELSAGQWQKLAVSRAFMRDAEVLILDEPTASIDAEAEHELFERFKALAADRIAIVISHRFSTVRMADRILVLRDGKLEELGTHQELLEKEGRYAHLFKLQAAGYQ